MEIEITNFTNYDLIQEVVNMDSRRRNFHNMNDFDFPSNIETDKLRKLIIIRTVFSLIRVFFLFVCYSLDNNNLNDYLRTPVYLMILHEIIVLSNFILSNILLYANKFDFSMKKVIKITDTVGYFFFFAWFVYCNVVLIWNRDNVIYALSENKYLTYYITVLVLFGYFVFARLLFAIMFGIVFSPCILFIALDNWYNKYLRATRLQVRLFKIILKISFLES